MDREALIILFNHFLLCLGSTGNTRSPNQSWSHVIFLVQVLLPKILIEALALTTCLSHSTRLYLAPYTTVTYRW
jgi:hypothetical protein